jgi:hypothetical protein
VSVEGDVLKLEAQREETRQEQGEGSFFSRKGQYSQTVSLPGPVQADKMTVERKENMLIVTLPKPPRVESWKVVELESCSGGVPAAGGPDDGDIVATEPLSALGFRDVRTPGVALDSN